MTGLWKKNAALEEVDEDADKKIDDAVGKCCNIICVSWQMFAMIMFHATSQL